MRGSRSLARWVLLFSVGGIVGGTAGGQQPGAEPSLGRLARQVRAERAKEKGKSVPVFTNDNLPSRTTLSEESKQTAAPGKAGGQSQAKTTPAPASPKEEGEEYFRSRAEAIRTRLEFHRRQLAVLQQQLGLARTEYYPDPQKTLKEESTPAFHADASKLQARIEKTRQQIAEDEKAMDALREELRRKGGDPGWIRP